MIEYHLWKDKVYKMMNLLYLGNNLENTVFLYQLYNTNLPNK